MKRPIQQPKQSMMYYGGGSVMTSTYKIPELLQDMMDWEQEIKHEVPYLETPTGYFLQFDPYVKCTP
jgi:hypothetical protein